MRALIPQRQFLVLLIVVTGAFALRLWGAGYGLPYSYHNDEYHEVMRAFQLGAGSFNFGRIGKGGLYLLLFVEYGIYFVVLKLLGVVNTTADFAAEFVKDPTAFYYMGRVTVALMGTFTVLAAFLVARRAYTTGAGLLAAMFLSVNVMHTDLSQQIVVDVPMLFFASVALWFAVRLATDGCARDYIWGAVFASLAVTTKIPALVLIVPLLVAHTYYVGRAGGGARQWFLSRQLWIAAALFAAILIVTNPGIVFVYKYASLFTGSNVYGMEALLDDDQSLLPDSDRPDLYIYYLSALRSSMGWPLFIVGISGVAYSLLKRTPADVVLVSFALVFFVAISSTTSEMYFARYVLPVVFIVKILAGRIVYDLWHKSQRLNVAVLLLVTALLVTLPAYEAGLNSYLYTQTDTRTLAKKWIEGNIPEGARIFIEGAKVAPVRNTVQLRNSAENLRELITFWSTREPRQSEYLKVMLRVADGKAFDLVLVPLGEMEDLQTYRDMQVEYFIITPRFDRTSKHRTPRSAQLAREIRTASDTVLIKAFVADTSVRPGPTVEIYGFNRRFNTVE